MFRIMVAEADWQQRKALEQVLCNGGYEVIAVPDGAAALEKLACRHVDLLVLDVVMPEMDGLELLKQLRRSGIRFPVLILSAKCTVEDRCRGLRLGADDYMAKPADREELLLRISALLRRSQAETERKLTVGRSVLSYDNFTLLREGEQTELPRKEFMILYKLLSHPGRTFTRRQLMDEIWDLDTQSEEHTVVVHINRLREKVGSNPDFTIQTIRGLGYKAVKSQ